MDGQTLSREVRQLINETSASAYIDAKSTYDYIYEAVIATAERTNAITSSQVITTVANQSPYKLNANYMKLYLMDSQNRNYVKYNDGSNDTFLFQKTYDSIYHGNQTDSVTVPSDFTITDAAAIANITGTAGATSAVANGEATLSDVLAPFTNVSVGDFVHNTTQDAHGIVTSVTSTSALVTALFVDTTGASASWAISDAYIVVPQGRFQLVLDPPPSTSGHTVTVEYVARPAAVYSPYRSYRLSPNFKGSIVKYACWAYKNRDREPNFGDIWFKAWDAQVRLMGRSINKALGINRQGYKVSFIKRGRPSGSYR